MTDNKIARMYPLLQEFHRKMDLLDKGYAEACCKVDLHKSCDEILADADKWYDLRLEKMAKNLIKELTTIIEEEKQ